jgi:hypothetical protein
MINRVSILLMLFLTLSSCQKFNPKDYITEKTGANLCNEVSVEQIDVGYPEDKDLFKAKIIIPDICYKDFLISISKSSNKLCDEDYIKNKGCAYFYNKKSIMITRNNNYYEVNIY